MDTEPVVTAKALGALITGVTAKEGEGGRP